MNRSQMRALPLAALALTTPLVASAKSLPKLVPSMSGLSPRTFERVGQRLNRDVVLPGKAVKASPMPITPFRYRLPGASAKRQGYSLDWTDGSLRFDTARAKAARKEVTTAPLNYDRFLVIEANLSVSQMMGPRDSLAFGVAYVLERRRPSYFVGSHNLYRTQDAALSLSWTHDDLVRLAGGLFKTTPIGGRTFAERQVELAGGGPLAAHGYALTANFNPSRNPDQLSLGIDVRSQRYNPVDAGLIDTSSGRNEARVAVFLRRSF
jgi:hypothetical protein